MKYTSIILFMFILVSCEKSERPDLRNYTMVGSHKDVIVNGANYPMGSKVFWVNWPRINVSVTLFKENGNSEIIGEFPVLRHLAKELPENNKKNLYSIDVFPDFEKNEMSIAVNDLDPFGFQRKPLFKWQWPSTKNGVYLTCISAGGDLFMTPNFYNVIIVGDVPFDQKNDNVQTQFNSDECGEFCKSHQCKMISFNFSEIKK